MIKKLLFMNIKAPIIMELIFIAISVLIYILTSNTFFIFNFLYIGTAISVGLYMMGKNNRYARNPIMLAVGCYRLFMLVSWVMKTCPCPGFWYYLSLGVFEGAVIHFLIAKILGPLLFGRGWCGYACWTAMILDLLPYKTLKTKGKTGGMSDTYYLQQYHAEYVHYSFLNLLILIQ